MANDTIEKLKTSMNRGIAAINVKTESSLEKIKIKTHIDSLSREIQKLLLEMGRLAYDHMETGEGGEEEIKELFEAVKEKKDEVRQLTEQFNSIDDRDRQILGTTKQPPKPEPQESGTICPNCGAQYATKVNFCRKCGQKMS